MIGEAAADALSDRSSYGASSSKVAVFADRPTIGAQRDDGFLHLQAHRSGRFLCIDIEPMIRKRRPSPYLNIAQSVLTTFAEATTRVELCELAVRGLRALTGYDRIMAWQFSEDDHVDVIAEAGTARLEPLLGLHFPAIDIPPQARRLYLRQRVGEIANSNSLSVPLLVDPALDDAAPLDLTRSALRGLSTLQRQYMRRMRATASLRISLSHGQDLWGLLVCQHMAPRVASPDVWAAADMIGQVVSLLLVTLGEAEAYAHRLERNDTLRALVDGLSGPLPLSQALAKAEKELLHLVGAAGAVVRISGDLLRLGRTPSPPAVTRAWASLQAEAGDPLAVGDLVLRHPELAVDRASEGSGAMLLRLASGADDAILWFRPEISQTVHWAEYPALPAGEDLEAGRLDPRLSFAALAGTAHSRSAPWADADVALARALGRAIEVEVALRTKAELARKSQLLEITLDHMSQGLLMVDADGLVQVCNNKAMHFLGVPSAMMAPPPHFEDILRLIWDRLRSAGQIPESQEDFVRVARMSEQPAAFERTWPNGEVIEVRSTPLPGGGGVRTYTDITRRKRDEAKLRVALDEAEVANRVKSEFLATMSHEIRSPLSGLIGVIEVLRETNLDADQCQMAGMAHRSALGLLDVLNDILDFSKIEAGALAIVPEAVDLRDLVTELVQPYQIEARRKGIVLAIRFGPDVPDRSMTDPLRLRQILNNLLSNAIKFTATGEIELRVEVTTDPTPTGLRFSVYDSGIGMTAEVLSRLFEPFVQADSSTTRDFGGTGLGLCISQRLAGLLDGTLTVASRTGEGSVFTLRLPLRPAAEAAQPRVSAPDFVPISLEGSGRVLVVDDDSTLRWLCRRQLELLGLNVDVAANGEIALEMLHAGPYALLMTDCHMPRMDGVALTRTIRASAHPALSGLPIIGLTADATAIQRERCREAGMNEVAIKPLSRAKLSLMLSVHLRGIGAIATAAPPAPLPPAETPETPLFDDEMYRDLFPAGDPEGPAWLEDYLKAAEGFSAEIQQFLSARLGASLERDGLAAAAHSLAGTSLTVGALRLGAAARTLEYAAADEDLAALREHRLVVDGELATARTIISAYIAAGDSSAEEERASAVLSR